MADHMDELSKLLASTIRPSSVPLSSGPQNNNNSLPSRLKHVDVDRHQSSTTTTTRPHAPIFKTHKTKTPSNDGGAGGGSSRRYKPKTRNKVAEVGSRPTTIGRQSRSLSDKFRWVQAAAPLRV